MAIAEANFTCQACGRKHTFEQELPEPQLMPALSMTADEILAATEAHWDFTDLPRPKDWWRCGACGSHEPLIRDWSFWKYPDDDGRSHRVSARCDVIVKCSGCGLLSAHGIALPDEVFERYHQFRKNVHWFEFRSGD